MITADIFIVGGGPAGLATAIAARQRGLSVALADLRPPPIDKACGEGLMPDGVEALATMGVRLRADEAAPFAGIRFIADGRVAEGRFGSRVGLGIRRTVLHRALAARAAQSGATLHWGARAEINERGVALLGGEEVRCRWIVGADGHGSRVRRSARCAPVSQRVRVGTRQHYRVAPWSDLVEVYWHERGQAYVTPAPRIAEMPQLFPALWKRLDGRAITSAIRGSVSASVALSAVMSERIALVGDASGSVDAITGEGVSLAFRQAGALTDALAQDRPALYPIAHRRIARMPRLMARVLVMVGEHRGLRRRVVDALASRPSAFNQLLAAHAGVISPTALDFRIMAGFVGSLIAAGG
jgi:2-polyprenyl-6-methoxyphenol hydroxylase-like FAD-dependent oxidoreductase